MDCPLIANVRSNSTGERFDHWVVAVPSAAGVTVFDRLRDPYETPTAEFLGVWSGVGITVGRDGADPLTTIRLGRAGLLLAGLLVAVVVARCRRVTRGAARAGVTRQFCGLCAGSLALAVAGNALFGDLRHHHQGVAVATAASRARAYRAGTLDDARKASASAEMLLVDARRELDYRMGTINGAVNIPVTASIWEIEKYLENLDRKTPVVVFCQSARCGYDETVGAELAALGFQDVTVCDEGWFEYSKSADLVGVP